MGGTERRSAGAGQDLSNKDTSQLLQRLKAFAGVALVPHRSGSPHMQALVSKLQDALASVERFPVQCSHLDMAPQHPALSGPLEAPPVSPTYHTLLYLTCMQMCHGISLAISCLSRPSRQSSLAGTLEWWSCCLLAQTLSDAAWCFEDIS